MGNISAGKGLAIDYLVNNHGFTSVSNSDQIREEILKRDLEINRVNLAEVAGDLREKFGADILAKRAWEKICDLGVDKVVFDAIRTTGGN